MLKFKIVIIILMNEDISILIFEKDKNLKNILFEQLNSSLGNKVSVFDNFDNLLDFIKKNIFKVSSRLKLYKNKSDVYKDLNIEINKILNLLIEK